VNARALKKTRLQRRKRSIRHSVFGTPQRPRLTVFRSLHHISAQLVDDTTGRTLCAAGTKTKTLSDQVKNGGNCKAAALVGQVLAEQAVMHGIKQVAFDRNGRRFHGRIKALADAARKTGLDF
jgi:large subunit ribosomal protein L18